MKRSEMVTYLTKLINTYEDCQLDETVANEILEGLEHMGMLPPSTNFSSAEEMGFPEGTKYFENIWEQENE